LLRLKVGFIGAQEATLLGTKYSKWQQARTIRKCSKGELDAAVVSVKSGKNGCNLQGMNWMVSLGWIPAYTEEEQAKGSHQSLLLSIDCRAMLSSRPEEDDKIQSIMG
jgi:hypothetical protein